MRPGAILVERSLTAQVIQSTGWWCSGQHELDPKRVHRDRGSACHGEKMAHVHEPADRSFGPFHGRPGGAGGDAPAGRIWSDVEHFQSCVAGQRPRARRPSGTGHERARLLVGRLVDGGRAPRGLEFRAQRRDDGLGLAGAPPGRARASPRAPRSAARALRGPSAAARRGAASRSSGSKRPAIAPSATACSVVTSVRSRCVSRSSRSAVSADSSRRSASPRSAASRSTVRASSARAASGSERRHLCQQPAGRFTAPRLDHPGRLRWNRFHVAPRHRAAADAHGRAPREIEAQLEAGHSDHRHGPVV